MSMFLWNSHSLVKKLSAFQSFIYSSSIHFLAITGTWLSDFNLDSDIISSNYIIFYTDKSSRGDGVMLSVSNLISFSIIPSSCEFEVIKVKIMLKLSSILCLVHVPPHSKDSYFNSQLDYLDHIL